MARLSRETKQWVRLGATARLRELDAERARILAAFPGLRRAGAGASAAAGGRRRRRRRISPEARARMSEGMRKYWAARRRAAKAKASGG